MRKLSFPYELRDIERYLKREILRSHYTKNKEDEEFPLIIHANNNTRGKWDQMRLSNKFCKTSLARCWDFHRLAYWNRDNRADKYYQCQYYMYHNVTAGEYNNRCVHTVHEFSPSLLPGYKISADADHLPFDRYTE